MNPNPITPPARIRVGDLEYTLYFQHRDFATGEHLLHQQGIDVWMLGPRSVDFWPGLIEAEEGAEGQPILLKEFDTFKAECLLFTGLLRRHPKLSFEQVQDLITFENQAVLGEVVAAAALAIVPIRKEEPAPAKEAEAAEPPPLPSASGGPSGGPSPEPTSDSATENSGA